MVRYGVLGLAALLGLLSFAGSSLALANDPPFGEPYLLIPHPGTFCTTLGPYPLGADLATVLFGTSLWRTDGTPGGPVFTSPHFPGFRFRARISAGDQIQEVRQEAACMEETLCLSGPIPGRSEVFVRIVGPKPNGRLWPTIAKFTTSTLEVWMEQVSAGETQYYPIEGAAPGKDDLTGLFDREGFAP